MIIWHIIAILLTLVLVTSGFDWQYFLSTRAPTLRSLMFPAVHIGGLLPILLPLTLIALGNLAGNARTRLIGWAVGQAEVMGVSSLPATKRLLAAPIPRTSLAPI